MFTVTAAQILCGGVLEHGDLSVYDGRIAQDTGGRQINAQGYVILPGIVDLHGDGFEHHLAPRKGAIRDISRGLIAAHAEIAANGITTAVMAQFYSWEGGMRGPEFAAQVFEALATKGAEFATDLIPQLRFEYLMMDHWDKVADLVARYAIPYVAFNDHVPHDALARDKKPPRLTGQALKAKRSPEAHWALLRGLHDAVDAAWVGLPRFTEQLRAAGARLASHDDTTAQSRSHWAQIGVNISEFPETREAAAAAHAAGDPVIMGAPNVLRSASHKGNVSALDLIDAGLCSALASDYHYPSLARAAFLVADQIGLGPAWDLVSRGPARVLGLSDRGDLSVGQRADFIVVDAVTHQIEGVFAQGRPTYVTGQFAQRLLYV